VSAEGTSAEAADDGRETGPREIYIVIPFVAVERCLLATCLYLLSEVEARPALLHKVLEKYRQRLNLSIQPLGFLPRGKRHHTLTKI